MYFLSTYDVLHNYPTTYNGPTAGTGAPVSSPLSTTRVLCGLVKPQVFEVFFFMDITVSSRRFPSTISGSPSTRNMYKFSRSFRVKHWTIQLRFILCLRNMTRDRFFRKKALDFLCPHQSLFCRSLWHLSPFLLTLVDIHTHQRLLVCVTCLIDWVISAKNELSVSTKCLIPWRIRKKKLFLVFVVLFSYRRPVKTWYYSTASSLWLRTPKRISPATT